MFIGTLANIGTVLAGAAIGTALGGRLPERVRQTVMASLGLLTLALGFRESLVSDRFVVVLAAVLLGALTGELLQIEAGLEWVGERLRETAGRRRRDEEESTRGRFGEGFVIASLVFCVGPLTVLGSIQDGLGDPELLFVKSGLDGFASIAFASVYGWGVAAAALTVAVVQGGIAGVASLLSGALSQPMVESLSSAGGILLLGVGLRLLGLGRIRVANLLPALLYAPLLTAWLA